MCDHRPRKRALLLASLLCRVIAVLAAAGVLAGTATAEPEAGRAKADADGTVEGGKDPGAPAASSDSGAATKAREASTASKKKPASPARPPAAPAAAKKPSHGPATVGPAKDATQAGPASTKPLVFTNEDLAKYARPEDRQVDAAAAALAKKDQATFEADALKKTQQAPATEAYRAKLRRDAEDRVKAAEARVEQLKRLALSEKNPFVASPRLNEDQQKERDGLSAGERVRKTSEELAAAEQELDAARANLQEVLRQLSQAR